MKYPVECLSCKSKGTAIASFGEYRTIKLPKEWRFVKMNNGGLYILCSSDECWNKTYGEHETPHG